jgi:nucleotide-binding universal stress UspA family protein
VAADWSIAVGPPADAVVRKAQEVDADLILIGAGEQTLFERFSAGPAAEAILQRAAQPVLAVRPGGPTTLFQTILCPVDQSAASRRGLDNAVRLARAFGGALVVLGVVPEVSRLAAAVETGVLAGAVAEHVRRWRDEFERFLGGEGPGVSWEKEVRQGVPHEEIVAAARDHQADLIVMGSTGRTGLARVLMGSVTRRVLHQLPCSLLTVKEEDVVEELLEEDVRHIQRLMAEGRGLATDDCAAAASKYRQVLAYDPFHLPALAGLAGCLDRLGRAEEAARYRRRARAVSRIPGREAQPQA